MQKKKNQAAAIRANTYYPTYPNEADVNYYTQKLVDIVTGIISGIGLFVSILFLTAIM